MCWCRTCQKLAAGSPTVNVLFPEADVHITGDVSWFTSVADSGNTVKRGFCPTCGSCLFSASVGTDHPMRVRAGVLDDPELIAPQANIWTKSAPSWANLNTSLPSFEGPPPSAPNLAR
jgi:hypothetical protein